jgi:hypothetical protein
MESISNLKFVKSKIWIKDHEDCRQLLAGFRYLLIQNSFNPTLSEKPRKNGAPGGMQLKIEMSL